MLKWLIGNHVKKEIKDHLNNLHLHLAHSFSNIKDDISNIHVHLKNKDQKFLELEHKIHLLETKLFYALQPREAPKQIAESEEDEVELKEEAVRVDHELTHTQQTILAALYQLQSQFNSPISFKSLAKYLYPAKDYTAVRTTLSEYLDLLTEYNLVSKKKVGRETVAKTTKKGQKLAKSILKNKNNKLNIEIG
ncbi:hypothetical protein J4442_04925 [Candidatus Woesearchaeota archaeon]|nr:hypothetical protein [Candidatus Woesearchaeota archaeon]